ncbi:MAG: chromosome segregation protein SMC, partial [Planctomycetota bacterium]
MRLRRLEAYGFKSFADRLTFDFDGGITAIIGPNGCGKSNVVDAMKWVVGEQSAKSLRGSEMTDVIFSGCSTRRPMPFAEVTLTLERDDGLDAGEVALTRRLYRDGKSEYHVNGKSARLKDFRELLMGTGIGTSAYSVIEQGRIGFILEASVKDRRAILEEAAGISRYKARRKVALRKLDRVETDLERIGQIHGEVEKRLRSVRRQAETALKFQELSERLRDLRMVFALEEFGRLSGDLDGHRSRIAELDVEEAATAARLGELDAKLAEADAELLQIDDRIRALESTRSETRSQRDVAQTRVRDAKARLVEIDNQENEDRQALAEHGTRVAAMIEERTKTEQALSDADTGEGDSELSLLYRQRREQLDTIISEIDGIIAEIESRKSNEVDCLRQLSRVEAERHSLAAARTGIQERRKRLDEQHGGHTIGLEQAKQRETDAQHVVEQTLIQAAEAHQKLDELIRAREEAQAEGQRLEHRLNELRHEEGRSEVRLRMLAETEKRLEGLFKGVKGVLQHMDRLPGICGIVADLFSVEQAYERAIETALGGRVQNIVTDSQHDAKAAINYLKRERRGRATFLPIDGLRGRQRPDARMLREPGVVGLGSELIEFERKYQPVFDNLLGTTVICETLDHAIQVQRNYRNSGVMLVTLDGEVINPGGAMTGGRQHGDDTGGLVSRKNEIRRLEEQAEKVKSQRIELGEQRDAAKKTAFDSAVAVEDQRKVISQAEKVVGDAKAELVKAERDRANLEEFAASFGGQLEELDQELARVNADAIELDQRETSLGEQQRSIEGELTRLQEVLSGRGQERDRLTEDVNNLRVDLATTEERREGLRNHLAHLERQLTELDDQRLAAERRIEGHQARREELQRQLTENQSAYEQAHAHFEELSREVDGAVKRRDELRSNNEEERQEQRALQSKARGLEREHQEHELKANEIGVRIEALSERI